jgi:hypothetical protein
MTISENANKTTPVLLKKDFDLLGERDCHEWQPIAWFRWDCDQEQTFACKGLLLEVWQINHNRLAIIQVGTEEIQVWDVEDLLLRGDAGQEAYACSSGFGSLAAARISLTARPKTSEFWSWVKDSPISSQ